MKDPVYSTEYYRGCLIVDCIECEYGINGRWTPCTNGKHINKGNEDGCVNGVLLHGLSRNFVENERGKS